MTALCADSRRAVTADGGVLELSALTSDGVAELYREGWAALQSRLGQPQAWFVSETLFRAAPVVSPFDAFLVHVCPADTADTEVCAAETRCMLYVHQHIRWFAGHFPGRPILPGVVQIDWVARHGPRVGFAEERFAGLSGIKFAAPVVPGTVLVMSLDATRKDRSAFVLESRDGVHSRGMLHYRA